MCLNKIGWLHKSAVSEYVEYGKPIYDQPIKLSWDLIFYWCQVSPKKVGSTVSKRGMVCIFKVLRNGAPPWLTRQAHES